MRVNSTEKQLGGLELTAFEDGLAERLRSIVIKSEAIKRNEHEVLSVVFQRQRASPQRIMHALRRILSAFVTGHSHRLRRSYIDFT